jgi:phosphoglucosamine mutase
MTRLFGTDGLRGVANADLSVEVVVDLGRAAATVLGGGTFLVGGDTRASTDLLTAALAAGLCSAGADVVHLGVIPTAGVAHAAAGAGRPGAVVSASHNPAPDNGIKFFGADGMKLPDAVEDAISECFRDRSWCAPTGGGVGRVSEDGAAVERYLDHLVRSAPAPLEGLRVVLDCGQGAGYRIAPAALTAAGASVDVIGAEPDGTNINDGCGATDLALVASAVVERGADLGVALDGDADRVLAVDASGSIVDGDQVLAITALDRHRAGRLRGGAVVATVMSNLGFHHAMAAAGVTVHETPVGDRYVLEMLRQKDLDVGGEQSGHTLYLDLATTGDGILTALQVCGVVASSGRPLSELAAVVERYPQVLVNVAVADKHRIATAPAVAQAVAAAEARLGDDGRVLLRPSGTENKVRVMVEAASETVARQVAEEIAAVVATAG